MEAVKTLLGQSTFLWLATLALSLGLAGCGRSQGPPDIRPPVASAPDQDSTKAEESVGLFHIVKPGQTLYWISRHYGVSLEKLIQLNHLSNPDDLYVDQRIFVPGARALTWSWPVPEGEILSYFGERRSGRRRHTGVDIRGKRGQEVLAVRSGRVLFSSSMRDYGRTIILDHGDGLRSLYAHNSKLLVQKGQQVYRGQAIARVGRTGNATTEHCHFEIRRGEVPVDPLPYLRQ